MKDRSKELKEAKNNKIIKMPGESSASSSNFLDKILGDVSKKSATQQIVLGAGSGWATGYVTMKVGKVAAIALGGGIILLQVANQQGYINVNWNKITRKVDKIADKVEEAVTKEKPGLLDKVSSNELIVMIQLPDLTLCSCVSAVLR